MTNDKLILLAVRALIIWLLLSLAGFYAGDKLISVLIPFYETVAEAASDDYIANISIQDGQESKIVLAATAIKAQTITDQRDLPAGTTIESKITVLHALVPIVIFFTIIFSWPVQRISQRVYLLILSIPAVLFISASTAPIQLLGQLEIGFQSAAAKAGFSREEPMVLTWMLLTEGGGLWLIAALTGLACCGIVSSKIFNK